MKKKKDEAIRLGVVGTGRIANRFVPECRLVKGIEVEGVYNPHSCSAEQFAAKHQLKFFSSDEEDFFRRIDAVYIASPHATHFNYIKNALLHEKHILCEKPMVLEKVQAEELYALAKEKKCVLMEGVKTAYCPGFARLLEIANSNKIGDIRDVEACFTKLTNHEARELKDINTGGSFTELASYTMLAIIKLLGVRYIDLRFDSIIAENGVDFYTKAYLKYESSFAISKTGLGVKSEGQLLVCGTKGYIRVDAPWWKTQSFEVCYENPSQNESFTEEFLGDGLRYEINDFVCAINDNSGYKLKLIDVESVALADIMEKFLNSRKSCIGE